MARSTVVAGEVREGFPRTSGSLIETPIMSGAVSAMLTKHPGRVSVYVPGEKLTEDETPYRSRMYVASRHSADGHTYAPGDPVSAAEAARQGLSLDLQGKMPFTATTMRCPMCNGRGKRSKMKGHRVGCGCVGCSPCNRCQGKGHVDVHGR